MGTFRGHFVDRQLLGEQVQLERRRVALTQAALAKKVGASQSQISQLERGQEGAVSEETLGKILSLLEIQTERQAAVDSKLRYCPNPLCGAAKLRENRYEYVDGAVRLLKKPCYVVSPHFSECSHCTECGTKLLDSCPDCGKSIAREGGYCGECGGPLISSSLARLVAEPAIRRRMGNRNPNDEGVLP